MRERSQVRVSCIMTARNAEKTITMALKSVLRALPRESEILVLLDDCSDKTETLVNRFGDSRLRIFSSRTNLGVAQGRNFLIDRAESEIIAVVDADDICAPWRFRRGIAAIQGQLVDFHFQQAIIFGRLGKLPIFLPQFPEKLSAQSANVALANANPFVHSSATFGKEAFLSLGGYRSVASEDYDLWLRASQSGLKLAKSGFYSVGYRVHSLQMSQSGIWKSSVNKDPALNELIELQRALYVGAPPLVRPDSPFNAQMRKLASRIAQSLGLETRSREN